MEGTILVIKDYKSRFEYRLRHIIINQIINYSLTLNELDHLWPKQIIRLH